MDKILLTYGSLKETDAVMMKESLKESFDHLMVISSSLTLSMKFCNEKHIRNAYFYQLP